MKDFASFMEHTVLVWSSISGMQLIAYMSSTVSNTLVFFSSKPCSIQYGINMAIINSNKFGGKYLLRIRQGVVTLCMLLDLQ